MIKGTIIALIGVAAMAALSGCDQQSTTPIGQFSMEKDMVGCHHRSALDPILKRASENDDADFNKLMNAFTSSGLCVVLKKGQAFTVENHSDLDGMPVVQIRPKGGKQKYWTLASATNL